ASRAEPSRSSSSQVSSPSRPYWSLDMSLQLLDRLYPKKVKAVLNHLPDLHGEEKPCSGQLGLFGQQDALRVVVIAEVVIGVKLGREVVKEEGDPVRLARSRRAFDDPR